MRRFEGKYGAGTQVVFMIEYDLEKHLVYVHDHHTTHVISPGNTVAVPGGDFYLYALVHGLLGDPSAQVGSLLDNRETGMEVLQVITPGVTQMQRTRRCDSADFSPFRGFAVDLTDADLSGVVFGAVDFRLAIVRRTRFHFAAIQHCTFGPRQLTGLDLRHAMLEKANLRGFDLTGTLLDGAALLQTNLTEATLERASLRGAQLDEAIFDRANAAGAAFDGALGVALSFAGATLTNATFERARLGQPEFAGATLAGASFKDALLGAARFAAKPQGPGAADLTGVDFDNADLMAADFTGADLTVCKMPARPPRFGRTVERRTRFVRAKLTSRFLGNDWSFIDATDAAIDIDASIESARLRAEEAILPKIVFAGRNLTGADFTRAKMQEARFGGCVLVEASFDDAMLEGADFTGANLEDANFNNAKLPSSVFAEAWLYGATFDHALLLNTNFSSAMLVQVDFRNIVGNALAGVNFARACLVSADFRNVNASPAGATRTTFSVACLAGADFSAALLGNVILTGAQLSSANGSIVVSHTWRPNGRTIYYTPTILPPARTGSDTTCPDGGRGPCSIERLRSVPVPDAWRP